MQTPTEPAVKERGPKTHKLKTLPEYFDAVADGSKTFEIRRDDRGFEVGDTLELWWYGQFENCCQPIFKPNPIIKRITYILRDAPQFGLAPGYCILGLGEVE